MDDKTIHDLAIAYAQVKLQQYQLNECQLLQSTANISGDSGELRFFLKHYLFAISELPTEYETID